MIKEVEIDGENIIIDFEGAPFWKYYVLQLMFLICYRTRLVDHNETEQIMKKVNKQQAFQVLMEERMGMGETYIDAMTEYMTEHQLEPKQVAKLISPAFLEKITEEAERNNVIKKDNNEGSTLPL